MTTPLGGLMKLILKKIFLSKRNMVFCLLFLFLTISLLSGKSLEDYKVRTFRDPETGKLIDEITVPGVPPKDRIPSPPAEITRSTVMISNVPAFDWSFGCSATSASMIAGLYDANNYPAMYEGPTNSGIMPTSNNVWPQWSDGYDTRDQCPLSATHNGLDGRTTNGHVDRFWKRYGYSDEDGVTYQDAYGPSNEPTGTYELCTADYMGTNQDWWNNTDGATTFYYSSDGSALENFTDCESYSPRKRDGARGLKLFFESRGYNVVHNYNQYIEEQGLTYGFSYQDYKDEIDAGRPVMIQATGHTMLGVGYDNTSTTIYIHNTWDHTYHTMTWGGTYTSGSYSGDHYGVGVFELEAAQSVAAPTFSPAGGNYTSSQDVTISISSPPTSGTTTIRYTTNGSTPTESSSLYSSPINIPTHTNMTLKAKGFNTLWGESSVSSATYNITGTVATPMITPTTGTYYTKPSCSITCSTPSSTIYFTTDGTDPNPATSPIYGGGFTIDSSSIIKALATRPNWATSSINQQNITVEPGMPNLIAPIDSETDIPYDANLQWDIPTAGAAPDGYKVYFGTSPNPTSFTDVGNVTSWTPDPQIDWDKTYYWFVKGYTTGRGDGLASSEWSFIVTPGDTGGGSGDNSGSGDCYVDVEPVNINDNPVDPDVNVHPDVDQSVTMNVTVNNQVTNPGLPNPDNATLAYLVDLNDGIGDITMTLYFDGLDVVRVQPDEVVYYDGSDWQSKDSATWDYTAESVSFDFNVPSSRASYEFVLNDGDTTLPVTLEYFDTKLVDSNLKVIWKTATEINLSGFNIYRSEDEAILGNRINPVLIEGQGNNSMGSEYEYLDTEAVDFTDYWYRLEVRNNDLTSEFVGPFHAYFEIEEDNTDDDFIPVETVLKGNFPNPFNPGTNVKFDLAKDSYVSIKIYDIKGKLIRVLINGVKEAGQYSIPWNGRAENGNRCTSGIYLYKIETANYSKIEKMILLK